MNTKAVLAAILLICLANRFMAYELQAGATETEKVYYGEVVEKNREAITLNVTPCGDRKTLQTISPYEELSSQDMTCGDGRSYVKVAVRERVAPDNDPDKNNKRPPTEPNKKKEKPPDEPPPGSSDRAASTLRGITQ